MKAIKVVAAVICDSLKNPTKIFATARGCGEFKGQLLIREIQEELAVKIEVSELIETIEYDYSDFHLSMYCFWCVVIDGEIILKEAESARWLNKNELFNVNWLPADVTLVRKLQNSLLM